jgi:hypothetical protein
MHWKSLSPLKASLSALLVTLPFSVLAASAERDDEVRPLEVASSSERPLRRPTVIQHPGKYVLRSDIHAEDTAIIIRASQVTLDLDGHFIWGPGGKKGVGIQVDGVSNVAVRKGTIGRFGTAVGVVNARNIRIEQLQLTGEDLGGTPPNIETGIMVIDSRGVFAQGNVIVDTFLGIFVRGGGSAGNRIAGNVITGGQNGQLGICYNPAPTGGSAGPRGDLVYNNSIARFRTGISLSTESVANIIRDNDIAYLMQAINEASPGTNVLLENASVQTFL